MKVVIRSFTSLLYGEALESDSRQTAAAVSRGNITTTNNPVGKVSRSEFWMEVDTWQQSYRLVTWLNLPEEQA